VGAHLLDAGIGLVFTVTAIVLGSPLTTWVFRRVDRDARTSPQVTKAASTLRGGRVIGWLERAAVLLTVIAGWPEGVALVVASRAWAATKSSVEPPREQPNDSSSEASRASCSPERSPSQPEPRSRPPEWVGMNEIRADSVVRSASAMLSKGQNP